jgi:hypothetical protein
VTDKPFVIGRLRDLPEGIRKAIEAQQVASLTEADAAVASCPEACREPASSSLWLSRGMPAIQHWRSC